MDKLISRIEHNPRDVNALVLRGFEYAGLGYAKAAADDFNEALLIEPDQPLALRLLRGMTGTSAPIQLYSPSENTAPKRSRRQLPARTNLWLRHLSNPIWRVPLSMGPWGRRGKIIESIGGYSLFEKSRREILRSYLTQNDNVRVPLCG